MVSWGSQVTMAAPGHRFLLKPPGKDSAGTSALGPRSTAVSASVSSVRWAPWRSPSCPWALRRCDIFKRQPCWGPPQVPVPRALSLQGALGSRGPRLRDVCPPIPHTFRLDTSLLKSFSQPRLSAIGPCPPCWGVTPRHGGGATVVSGWTLVADTGIWGGRSGHLEKTPEHKVAFVGPP